MYTAYANYVIYFSDAAEYAAAIALCGGNGYGHCPKTAATQFGIAWPLVTSPLQTKGMYGSIPYGIPASPGVGIEVGHPNPSGIFLTSDVDSVIVPGQTGIPAITPGPDMQLVWWGVLIKINAQAGGSIAPPTTPIPQRRWIGGYEFGGILEEGGSAQDYTGDRTSSRTKDGRGLAIRGTNSSRQWQRPVNEFIPGFTTRTSWERFYVRVTTLGATTNLQLWQCRAVTNTAAGAKIKVAQATGALQVYTVTSGNVETLRATASFPFILGKWYLIDVLLKYASSGPDTGRLRVYINHVLDIDYVDSTSNALDLVDNHALSLLGNANIVDTAWNADLDDWMCADVPNVAGVEHLDSIDWQMGSHIRPLHATSVTATNWTGGSAETCNQEENAEVNNSSAFVSTTALATIEELSDIVDEQVYPGVVLGIAAIYNGTLSYFPVGSANSRIGYKVAGGATAWTTVSETGSANWRGALYRPSGLMLPSSVVPYSVLKEKSNDATSTTVTGMGGVVEYIGQWGQEDEPNSLNLSNLNPTYLHNVRFSNTQFGTVLGPPTAPCYAIGGTYVGTGTTKHINLPAPAHFVWIRPLTGSTEAVKFFGASLGAHRDGTDRVLASGITRSWIDSTGQAKISFAGAHPSNNAIGVVYQYIIFCDPGMRFNYCGAYCPVPAITNLDIPLFVSTFSAQFGFVQREALGSASGTINLTCKGVGNAGLTGQAMDATAKANWGAFSAGNLNIRADNIAATINQYDFSLWRTTDPDCSNIAVQITSYVGDGGGFKLVNLPLVTGKYPLLAIVSPQTNVGFPSYMRDPSHTGVNCCTVLGLTNETTAIMGGGIDQLFMGVRANQNLVKYEVFCIMGDSAGWNNGVFNLPNCISKGPWVAPTYVPPGITDGGVEFNGAATTFAIQDVSGIYTLIPDKLTDTLYDRLTGQPNVDVAIPNPYFKTGYIGG